MTAPAPHPTPPHPADVPALQASWQRLLVALVQCAAGHKQAQ